MCACSAPQDLNGNGLIEANELKAAIMASGQSDIDDEAVDNMIAWGAPLYGSLSNTGPSSCDGLPLTRGRVAPGAACTKTPNGDIDFEEYCAIMRLKLPYFKTQVAGANTI